MVIPVLMTMAAVVCLLIVVVALLPGQFRIARTTVVAAPASAVFAQVNDFRNWEGWSPWAKLDPAMKQTYDGSPAGIGASHSWNGNNKVGEGRSTIVDSRPPEQVRIKLEFVRPFRCANDVEFNFTPEGDQTNVTWSMTGTNKFMGKAFGLIMNMDKCVGGDFEKGLAALKSIAESGNRSSS